MASQKKKSETIEAVVYEKESDRENIENRNDLIRERDSKPYFFPRLIAYIIDILLVSIICSGIMFFLPENKNYKKYMNEYEQIQIDRIEEKITREEYINKSIDIVYDIDYSNVLTMIVQVVLIILYFIVFQFYNNGQTIGKKLMKLRIVSMKDEKLTLNQIAYRSLIINSVLSNILVLGSLLFIGRNYYYYISMVLQGIFGMIIFITLMMIIFRKDGRGLHDILAGTKVIGEN